MNTNSNTNNNDHNGDSISLTSKYYGLARGLTLLCYFTLLAVMLYGSLFFGPEGIGAKLILWLLMSLGLLLVLLGLLAGKQRSYIWLCFILLMYFIYAVQLMFSGGSEGVSPVAGHEIIAMVAIVLGFCTSMIASRGVPA